VTINHYGDPGYDQLAMALNTFSWTLRNEAWESLKVTKITEFFGEPLCKDFLHLSDSFKHLTIMSPHWHPAMQL